jgi:hypothetical protein
MNIVIRAGKRALQHIQANGLHEDDIDLFAGASGGPKCFILYGFDKAIFGNWFMHRSRPLNLLGSSIGSYRIAAIARTNPGHALRTFYERYTVTRALPGGPRSTAISDEAREVLEHYFDAEARREVLSHPFMRAHMITARARGIGAHARACTLLPFLGAAATANLVSRKFLPMFFERCLFRDPRSTLDFGDIPPGHTRTIDLDEHNIFDAVSASGSIPYAMQGVTPSGTTGTFRDGGIIDYHFDLPFNRLASGLTLYPHFFDKLVPGWFDKALPWRKPAPRNYDNVVFVAPTAEFIATLPDGKVSDRNDIMHYKHDHATRIRNWQTVMRESERLGDEFLQAATSGGIAGLVRPIEEIL